MPDLFKLIWDICCLRRGPQDLPYSPALLAFTCVAFLALRQSLAWLLGADGETLGGGLFLLLINLGALYLLLTVRNLRNRFVQAACALIGCAMVFLLMSVPLSLMFGTPPPNTGAASPLQVVSALLSLPLLAWKLVVDAHVLRHSLGLPFLTGMAIAVLWLIVEVALNNAGGGAGPAA